MLDTHGYFLDDAYLQDLLEAGVTEVIFDLKAWDEQLHVWYTGYSNQRILENIRNSYGQVKLVVNTVYIPGIVEEREIEHIARFLSELEDEEEIDYRINRFRAELSHEKIARNPYPEEIERAYSIVPRSSLPDPDRSIILPSLATFTCTYNGLTEIFMRIHSCVCHFPTSRLLKRRT